MGALYQDRLADVRLRLSGRVERSSREWRVEFRDASLPVYGPEIELSSQLQNNGKKGTKLGEEDFMCHLKLQ
jgi:hypothetical protein